MEDSENIIVLPRTNTIVVPRNHWYFHLYRKLPVQVVIKVFLMSPLLFWWVLWVGDTMVIEDAEWDDFFLSGSVVSYTWLTVSTFFNWTLALDMWSYFSIFWSVAICLEGVELITLDELAFGIILQILGLLSLVDGLVSVSFRLPRIERYSEDELYEPKKEEELPVEYYTPTGIPFMLIPLDGGPSVPLGEYPSMSTPSTSSQAYDAEYTD